MIDDTQQGINITGATAPGVTSVGGFMTMKSLGQLQAEEKQRTALANAQPIIQSLATHIRRIWTLSRLAKEQTVEPRMLKSMRQRRGEYDPDKLAQIQAQGGTTIYMMLTSNKCRAASSWIRDVLLTAAADQPWTISSPNDPELSPEIVNQIHSVAQQQLAQEIRNGAMPSDMEVRQRLINMRDQALIEIKNQADAACERMAKKMQDQMVEGGWLGAFSDFIDDLTTFPSAVMKGPVVRKRPKLNWVQTATGYELDVQDELGLEWERVDPFNIYPIPDASNINDGDLIERHRLRRSDLTAMKGVEGYSDKAIDEVLDAYGRGGLHEWLMVDNAKAMAEGKATSVASTNPSELIDALQYWGSVQGKLLIEWGYKGSNIDPLQEYNIEAWLIGSWVIKAVMNPDPLGRKPYYKASYEEIPGAFWGNSVADLCRDTQDICNAAARALVNNMGIASGPQVVYNVDRLPQGEDVTNMYPWKVWQVTADPTGSTQPPMQFFQPQAMSQELMYVYDKFATLADEYTGIPRYMTGDSPAGGAGRTATGMSMLMGNAGKSIKQVISNIDINVIEPVVSRLYFYNMRYSDDDDLKGSVTVVARGAEALMIREAAQQRRNEFLNVSVNSPIVQEVVGKEGIAAILRETAKGLAMDTDDIVPPIEILKQRWADQALAQQNALMMQAQQGNQQPPGISAPGGTPAALGPNGAVLGDGTAVANNFVPGRKQ